MPEGTLRKEDRSRNGFRAETGRHAKEELCLIYQAYLVNGHSGIYGYFLIVNAFLFTASRKAMVAVFLDKN